MDWDGWIGIFRDAAIVVIGGFILVYETVVSPMPNAELIGAGLVLLGLPPALRLDLRTRKDKKDDER